MPEELERELAHAVERIPAFPQSVRKIIELTRSLNCQPKDLVAVVEKDPVMTIKILKALNSAYYNLPNKITSINHAVVYLGFNTIKNLALSVAALGIFPRDNKAGFDIQQYLFHSLAVAGVSRLLAHNIGHAEEGTDCYIAGLLHDFGKVVFAQYLPEQFNTSIALSRAEGIPLYLAEKRIIGTDHAKAGAMVAEKWKLPLPLIDCIRHHHDAQNHVSFVLACVFAANQLCKRLGFGYAGNDQVEELPDSIAEIVGGKLEKIEKSVGDVSRIAEEAAYYSRLENDS